MRGRTVWIVITHAIPALGERDLLLQYLDAIGTRRSEIVVPARSFVIGGLPAEAFRYDLREPNTIGTPSAESFSFEDRSSATARFACLNGPASIKPRHLKSGY